MVKNPPANAGDSREVGSILGSERFPGEENGNPLQYPCLENSMDGGTWCVRVHRVAVKTQQSAHKHTYRHVIMLVVSVCVNMCVLIHVGIHICQQNLRCYQK